MQKSDIFITEYKSPIGGMCLASDDDGLMGAWFVGQKHFGEGVVLDGAEQGLTSATESACRWLDDYFAGRVGSHASIGVSLGFPLKMKGTDFQRLVWQTLMEIPYGKILNYGEIARRVAALMGKEHMSAQAVGGAVGRNRFSVIVPCHRVVGVNGKIVGYAGGLEKKEWLLEFEMRTS